MLLCNNISLLFMKHSLSRKTQALGLALCLLAGNLWAQDYRLTSPDGRLNISIDTREADLARRTAEHQHRHPRSPDLEHRAGRRYRHPTIGHRLESTRRPQERQGNHLGQPCQGEQGHPPRGEHLLRHAHLQAGPSRGPLQPAPAEVQGRIQRGVQSLQRRRRLPLHTGTAQAAAHRG